MLALILVVVFTLLGFYLGPTIRKSFLITAISLAVIAVLATVWSEFPLLKPFYQGFVGLAFFYIVMITGALNLKSTLRKKLNGVRKEYSIYGFISLTPHALKYLWAWLQGTETFEWWGVLSFVVMIPLFITSFYLIRKKMTPKRWKQLQQFAYLAYGLLFVHLILRYTETINLVIYILMIVSYTGLKLFYQWQHYRKVKQLVTLSTVITQKSEA